MFTQTNNYLSWHQAINHKSFYKEYFELESSDLEYQIDGEKEKRLVAKVAAVVIEMRLGKILYCPYGPDILDKNIKKQTLDQIVSDLHAFAKKENCIFVRLENLPEFEFLWSKISFLVNPPVTTFRNEGIFQPRVEWWKALGEEDLMLTFSKNHRYSIRKSEKDEVKIEIVKKDFSGYFPAFYKLMQETSERDGFFLHEEKYYRKVFETLENTQFKGFLVFGSVGDCVNSAALCIVYEDVANYVYGASSNYRRESGSSVRVQYEAMKIAKEMGANFYNFGGVTEEVGGLVYGRESLSGVTKFKKQFGGFAKFHGKFLDIPIKKIWYLVYIFWKFFR